MGQDSGCHYIEACVLFFEKAKFCHLYNNIHYTIYPTIDQLVLLTSNYFISICQSPSFVPHNCHSAFLNKLKHGASKAMEFNLIFTFHMNSNDYGGLPNV